VLLPSDGDSTQAVHAVRDALLTPVMANAADTAIASTKLALLAQRPLRDPALGPLARCADAPVALDHEEATPDVATLERWRAASDGLGRVVFGAAGRAREVDGVASALLGLPAWPNGQATEARSPAPALPFAVYDASPEVAGGAARVSIVLHTGSAAASTRAAIALAAPDGPMVTRLHALDASAAVRDVTATAQAGGGCLAVTLDVSRVERHHDPDGDTSIATAVIIARQEAGLAMAGASGPERSVRSATLSGDPREASELAAWWALVNATAAAPAPTEGTVIIGLGGADDAPDFASHATDLTRALERTEAAWHTRIVDARRDIERGQGSVWVLLASPCGALAEGDADAGLTALAVSALTEQARPSGHDGAEISEWITIEGAGLIARATRREGESGVALARRAGDAVGAALMTASATGTAIARARAELMTTLSDEDARSFATLAQALTPGHPSWAFPLAGGHGLEAWPDGAVLSRISALRHGPLRVAILGNDDAAQVEAATLAVDRWIPHPSAPSSARACAAHTAPLAPRPGTYLAPSSAAASAWLAVPLPQAARSAATVVAAALDGPDGLLARALSSGLASAWSARVVGPGEASALAIHVRAPGHTLDAAVAQVRALLDRLRQGGLSEEDRARARASLARAALTTALDPRERLVRLWRGDDDEPPLPPLDALRTFLANDVRDDSLVIVATRPLVAKPTP
jgi:hypothetical protein